MDAVKQPPHQQLLQARERDGWSREDVAAALNLTAYTVAALEEGRYAALHGEAYVTGYMRGYAELFALDANALVQAFLAGKHETPLVAVPARQVPGMRQSKAGLGMAAAALLVVGLGVFTALKPGSGTAHSVDAANNDAIAVQTAVGTTVISSVDELPDENPTQDMLPQVVLQQQVPQKQVENLLQQRILGESFDESAGIESSSFLSFQFSADCWVEIVDGDDQLIFASLQKAQERLELSGKPPFRITLGYAPGVALSYNGQPVDINANNANIAKLVLGNS